MLKTTIKCFENECCANEAFYFIECVLSRRCHSSASFIVHTIAYFAVVSFCLSFFYQKIRNSTNFQPIYSPCRKFLPFQSNGIRFEHQSNISSIRFLSLSSRIVYSNPTINIRLEMYALGFFLLLAKNSVNTAAASNARESTVHCWFWSIKFACHSFVRSFIQTAHAMLVACYVNVRPNCLGIQCVCCSTKFNFSKFSEIFCLSLHLLRSSYHFMLLCMFEIDIHTKTYVNTHTHIAQWQWKRRGRCSRKIQQTENRLNSKCKQTTSAFALLVGRKWMGNSLCIEQMKKKTLRSER